MMRYKTKQIASMNPGISFHHALLGFLLLSATGFSRTPVSVDNEESKRSQFQLEKDLLNTLYQGSLSESSTGMVPHGQSLSVTAQFSFVSAGQFRVSNNYWDVPYEEQLGGLPAFFLYAAVPVIRLGNGMIHLKGGAGYANREAAIVAISKQTGKESKSLSTLHWMPVSLGTRFEYQILRTNAVIPRLDLEAGGQWIYQSGKLDGIEQGFWIPFYSTSLSVLLFGSSNASADWFGGVSLGGTLRNSFASQQNIRVWSADIGLNLYL